MKKRQRIPRAWKQDFQRKLQTYRENPTSLSALLAAYSAASTVAERRKIPQLQLN